MFMTFSLPVLLGNITALQGGCDAFRFTSKHKLYSLTVILKKAGVSVVSFSRFEQIDYKKVDVLYLDVMLWGKSCLKEYADLRQKNPNLIIIFISGSDAHDGLKDILVRDNRAALLLKPYHESEPVDKLINLLAKN